jgi:hypothetical protein
VNGARRLEVDRRAAFLAALTGGACVLAGCTGGGGADATPSPVPRFRPTTRPRQTGRTEPAPIEDLPESSVWRIRRSEVVPEIKRTAVRLVEALGQWPRGLDGRAGTARRMRDMDIEHPRAEPLARQAGPLLGDYPEATVPVSQEIVRSLVGSLGIIAAVPMTTAVAVAVAMSILRQ